ncbi:MAG: hypothetical protein ABSB76_21960 [Streptosporangiaceae bacterium]|jgi:hypothetical protein
MAKRTDNQITIDDAMTKTLNQSDLIHDYMVTCSAALYQRFQADPRVFFYVKGSAALSRYLRNNRVPDDVINRICARSDWDTQLVINPWLSRAEWFAAFQDCLTAIREYLDNFEEGLLAIFTRLYPPQQNVDQALLGGKSADPAIRKRQNDLAKALREAVAAQFGQLFLATSQTAGFIDNGPNHWDLPWRSIQSLVPAKVKDILELDIQAHSQATLTYSLIHPGQALDNLNSIMTGRELRLLKTTTQTVAEGAWTDMDAASDAYDLLRMQLIGQTPQIVKFLTERFMESQSDLALVNSLPAEIIEQTIGSLPSQDRDRLTPLWDKVKAAKTQQLINADGGSVEETRFGQALSYSLQANQVVAKGLSQWCLANMNVQPAMLAATAALYDHEITAMLDQGQRDQLDRAREEVEARLERYREEPDPEDVAEAEKRETEGLAPFTLVSVEKGSRKIGSILENMTIRDFYLFRLMIRCQLSNKDPNNRLIPDAPQGADFDSFKQQFKFRAELLDISVPRDDSLETAEQWAHVRDHIRPDGQGIPLPDGSYFIDEYILMFREVLDKKSSSAHKLTKRLQRACLIAGVYAAELGGDLAARRDRLAARYPVFAEALKAQNPVADANLVVFMRMCEQLVESYDLGCDERLRNDSSLMMLSFAKQITGFLTTPLTDKTFLGLLEVFTQLSRMIYNETFMLGQLRQKPIPNDTLAGGIAAPVVAGIGDAFGNDPRRVRCAVVEDFAIAADPDLPDSLKQALPLNVLTIIAYTNDAGRDLMTQVADGLDKQIRGLAPGHIDTVRDGSTLYARVALESVVPAQQPGEAVNSTAMAVFLKVTFVCDNNAENWIAPTHSRDLRAIVKQYRRSLPAYTDYHILTQKKNILQQMETILTTY